MILQNICCTILQNICSTILQFAPQFHNLLHDFTICSTIIQFAQQFYNLLHDFTISFTILQFAPRFYNLLHDFVFCSTILYFAPRFCPTILQFAPRFCVLLHNFVFCSTILYFGGSFYSLTFFFRKKCSWGHKTPKRMGGGDIGVCGPPGKKLWGGGAKNVPGVMKRKTKKYGGGIFWGAPRPHPGVGKRYTSSFDHDPLPVKSYRPETLAAEE